jgi:hypothetical protein
MFFILFINSTGFYVYYILQLKRIHAEMREQMKHLPADQLDVLHLSYQEFLDARVEEHEVKVKGKMYDIARIEQSGDRVTVFGLHDELGSGYHPSSGTSFNDIETPPPKA